MQSNDVSALEGRVYTKMTLVLPITVLGAAWMGQTSLISLSIPSFQAQKGHGFSVYI